MGTTSDVEVAAANAWQELADACVEHDQGHEQRAVADLRRLHQLPAPRQPAD